MDVEVGSNLYRNTDGMIEIEGVPQIQVALKPTTGALLVNFALFDAGGKVTAKLVDSTLMINERRAYEVNKTPKSLLLTHPASGTVVLQLDVKAPDVKGLVGLGVRPESDTVGRENSVHALSVGHHPRVVDHDGRRLDVSGCFE